MSQGSNGADPNNKVNVATSWLIISLHSANIESAQMVPEIQGRMKLTQTKCGFPVCVLINYHDVDYILQQQSLLYCVIYKSVVFRSLIETFDSQSSFLLEIRPQRN